MVERFNDRIASEVMGINVARHVYSEILLTGFKPATTATTARGPRQATMPEGKGAGANWLSNHIFSSYDDIVDHCCFARNRLVDQP